MGSVAVPKVFHNNLPLPNSTEWKQKEGGRQHQKALEALVYVFRLSDVVLVRVM